MACSSLVSLWWQLDLALRYVSGSCATEPHSFPSPLSSLESELWNQAAFHHLQYILAETASLKGFGLYLCFSTSCTCTTGATWDPQVPPPGSESNNVMQHVAVGGSAR